ncbi:MAG: complex I subunit 4 family protein [Verrucomicrobiota bacterium]
MNGIPLLLLATPLIACLLVAWGFPAKRIAILSALLSLFLCAALALNFQPHGARWQFETHIPWIAYRDLLSLQFHIGIDGINLAFLLLTAIISLTAMAVTPENIARAKEFFICLLLISFGSMGSFLSLDLFFFYLFHEIALIPTFLLIALWGFHEKKVIAWQMTIYLAMGSLLLLAGILAFYFALPAHARALDIAFIKPHSIARESQAYVFFLLLAGFGVLASLWPFHNWAPKSYAASPPATAIFHTGVLKQIGFYGLLRIAVPFLPQALADFSHVLFIFLLMNILYIGWVALAQKHLDMMLGFSSVMHIGYLFLGLVCLNLTSLTGAVFLAVAYGLSSAMLFGLMGEIRRYIPSLAFQHMGGLASKTPRITVFFIFAALASIGLPGLAGFPGEMLVIFGAWTLFPIPAVLALAGIFLSTIYMLRAIRSIFFGAPTPQEIPDIQHKWPYILLSSCILFLGIYPASLTQWLKPALKITLGL